MIIIIMVNNGYMMPGQLSLIVLLKILCAKDQFHIVIKRVMQVISMIMLVLFEKRLLLVVKQWFVII